MEDKENDDPEDTEGQTSRLWVDRFSPRHYTELLSDDVSFLCDLMPMSTTYFKWMDKSKCHTLTPVVCNCFAVVYQPLSAQVVETLGHRCVWKREEVPPRSV